MFGMNNKLLHLGKQYLNSQSVEINGQHSYFVIMFSHVVHFSFTSFYNKNIHQCRKKCKQ